MPAFLQLDYLQVFADGKLLKYPWAGSINSGQIAMADLNNDGLKDIVVFEKAENRMLSFLSMGNGTFELDRAYIQKFPSVNGWLICKDFNCDGIDDFFTYSNGSIEVHKGFYINDTLHFEKLYDELFYKGFSANPVNLYSSFVDKPALYDIDNDGDLDILTFNVTANRLLWYSNQRIENGWKCDSLAFKLTDYCWGNIFESGLSPLLDLRDTCQDKSPALMPEMVDISQKTLQHTGSTLDVFDVDNNGTADVLMGDVSLFLLNYLPNSGTLQEASILAQDTAFPSYNVPVRIASFPDPVFADINNDGKMDLVVTPFEGFGTDNVENIWYYQNQSDDSIQLALQSKSFLIEDMIDAGEASFPCLMDIDGDGLKDLLIGSGGVRRNGNAPLYPLYYYRNIGTTTYPVFSLESSNFLNFAATGLAEPAPAAGDIDNDGDTDLLIGIADGRILWYKNLSGNKSFLPDNPSFIFFNSSPLDVGQNAAVSVADVDGDNKNDLVIGERNGNINYYKNIGATGSLSLVFVTDSLGKFTTATSGIPFGYAAPQVKDVNGDSRPDLIVGGFEYVLYWLNNIRDSVNLKVNPVPLLKDVSLGRRMVPVVEDISADGKMEMILGLLSGGLWMFSQDPPPYQPVSNQPLTIDDLSVKIFPNPGKSQFMIEVNNDNYLDYQLNVYDLSGRNLQSNVFKSNRFVFNFEAASGLYIIAITNGLKSASLKLIVD